MIDCSKVILKFENQVSVHPGNVSSLTDQKELKEHLLAFSFIISKILIFYLTKEVSTFRS
jgi:hypothetical protein